MKKIVFDTTRIITLVFILSVIVLASLLATGAWGRYFTSGSGGDGATVARFSVRSTLLEGGVDTESFAISMKPNMTRAYTIKIDNDSEVAVRCEVKAINETGNIPLKFSWENTNGEEKADAFTDDYGIGQEDTYTLTVTWENVDNDFAVQGMVDHVVISVHCEQID